MKKKKLWEAKHMLGIMMYLEFIKSGNLINGSGFPVRGIYRGKSYHMPLISAYLFIGINDYSMCVCVCVCACVLYLCNISDWLKLEFFLVINVHENFHGNFCGFIIIICTCLQPLYFIFTQMCWSHSLCILIWNATSSYSLCM